jgi:single-stranded DNA-binding protein
MTFGFNLQISCGRIASISEAARNGRRFLQVRILSKPSERAAGERGQLWVDAEFWGRAAEGLLRGNFRKGDRMAVCISNMRQSVWQDQNGDWKPSISGKVDKYWDLRSGKRPLEDMRFDELDGMPQCRDGSMPFPEDEGTVHMDGKAMARQEDKNPMDNDNDRPEGPRP